MKTKKSKDLLIATMKELQDKETMKINGGRWPLGCNGAWFVLNRPRTPPVGVGCARRQKFKILTEYCLTSATLAF